MAGIKGQRIGGRQKGTPNKTTRDLKEAILGAFQAVGAEKYLQRIADEDPRTFCALLGKVIPLTLQGDAEHPLTITVATGIDRGGP